VINSFIKNYYIMTLTQFNYGITDGTEVRKSGTYTVVSNTDSGKTFISDVTTVYTLPAIAIGNVFTFIYDGEDGSATITLSPNAADGVTYVGSQVDDKDLILAAATAKKGDYVKIAAIDQVIAWQVVDARGVWTKQA
jgi:hypothetical protein